MTDETTTDQQDDARQQTPQQRAEAEALASRSALGPHGDVPDYKKGHGTVTQRLRDQEAAGSE